MQIWVDADACPGVIKEILFRAAERAQISMTLVANQLLRPPPSRYIKTIQVPAGFDVADGKIVQHLEPGDLVITADIPLRYSLRRATISSGCIPCDIVVNPSMSLNSTVSSSRFPPRASFRGLATSSSTVLSPSEWMVWQWRSPFSQRAGPPERATTCGMVASRPVAGLWMHKASWPS